MQAARSESEFHCRNVDDYAVAKGHVSDEVRVGEGICGLAIYVDLELDRSGPGVPDGDDFAASESKHEGGIMRRMDPFERQMDLLGLFLELRRPVTFVEIRERIPDAYPQGKLDSAKRQFERDKDEMRELGIPIESVQTDDGEDAYLVSRERYYLPEIEFTPEEAAALCLAGNSFGDDDAAQRALHKLLSRADSGVFTRLGDPLVVGGPDFAPERLDVLAQAVADRRSVRFSYRTAAGVGGERHVDPWALVHSSGHFYLVGEDRERGEIRAFRLSRFASGVVVTDEEASEPPSDFDARAAVSSGPWGPDQSERIPVRMAFSEKVAWLATSGLEVEVEATEDDWTRVVLQGSLDDTFVSWVVSFGPDARVLEPAVVRDAVIERLQAVAGG